MEFEQVRELLTRLHKNLSQVIFGQERKLQWLLAAFSSAGHVLLEDVPGHFSKSIGFIL